MLERFTPYPDSGVRSESKWRTTPERALLVIGERPIDDWKGLEFMFCYVRSHIFYFLLGCIWQFDDHLRVTPAGAEWLNWRCWLLPVFQLWAEQSVSQLVSLFEARATPLMMMMWLWLNKIEGLVTLFYVQRDVVSTPQTDWWWNHISQSWCDMFFFCVNAFNYVGLNNVLEDSIC